MVDGTVHLNRFGLERGRMWPALFMILAVAAPAILWTVWDGLVDGKEPIAAGTRIELSGVPPPGSAAEDATIRVTIPDDGWSTNLGENSESDIKLLYRTLSIEVEAVAGASDRDELFDRRSRQLTLRRQPLFTTSTEPVTETGGLDGFRGYLVGNRLHGTLTVLGAGESAAVFIASAPSGRESELSEAVIRLQATLEVT